MYGYHSQALLLEQPSDAHYNRKNGAETVLNNFTQFS